MPVHDWTLVDAGIFHAFHTLWITHINEGLNEGLLPSGYYALPEQHAGESIADILTLHKYAPSGRARSGARHRWHRRGRWRLPEFAEDRPSTARSRNDAKRLPCDTSADIG